MVTEPRGLSGYMSQRCSVEQSCLKFCMAVARKCRVLGRTQTNAPENKDTFAIITAVGKG